MSDFLIYAARMQDSGVERLTVVLDTADDHTRLMHVSVGRSQSLEMMQKFPTRTFELCGTDRVLEKLKDDILYSDGGVTPDKVQAAIDTHPLLRDDLCSFLADWSLTEMPTAEEVDAQEPTAEDEAAGQRMADKIKAWMHGIDIARRRDVRKAT